MKSACKHVSLISSRLSRRTPFMLDSYGSEWEEKLRNSNKHAVELDSLRGANRNLSSQV